MVNKKTAGSNKQNQLEKEYEKQLKNGTKLKVKIILETDNFNKLDFEDTLSQFASISHNFYLHAAKNIKNKPL